jgi:UDP-GlcNAc3NAcA epimerase
MKFTSIVGARPQFIKVAPLVNAFARHNQTASEPIENVLVHTGQHYDAQMSDVFFQELDLPQPAVNLGVGSAGHGAQTGQMLEKIEQLLLADRPDLVVIYGDTNSTVAGALAAAKCQIPVAHIEAGVRSFNRRMPEEINRVVADHASDLLLAPTATAVGNLQREGLQDRTMLTGDVMYDAVLAYRETAERRSRILERLQLRPREYYVATVHRAENTDDDGRMRQILQAFNETAAAYPLVVPLHPRTAKTIRSRFPDWSPHVRLQLIEPLGYLDMLRLVAHARVTLTDSGGLQKEAFFLECPCITLRNETEWVETVSAHRNVLSSVEPAAIQAELSRWERVFQNGSIDRKPSGTWFGDGNAAANVTDALLSFSRRRKS